jgi:hypothetical protein
MPSSDEDSPGNQDEISAARDAYPELVRDLHQARGEFLARFNQALEHIDPLVVMYFGLPAFGDGTAAHLRNWVLGRLTDQAKIDLCKQVLAEIGLADATEGLHGELNELLRTRNVIAHSAVGPAQTENWQETAARYRSPHHYSTSRSGFRAIPADLSEIQAAMQRADDCMGRLISSWMALLGERMGDATLAIEPQYRQLVASFRAGEPSQIQ